MKVSCYIKKISLQAKKEMIFLSWWLLYSCSFTFVWEAILDSLRPLKLHFWIHIQKRAICTGLQTFSDLALKSDFW